MEWFVNFYAALQDSGIPYVEATVSAGELVFVPRGWWHVVLNLEDSIAVTQNYVPASQLAHTLLFLSDKADQVSGVPRGELSGKDAAGSLSEKKKEKATNALSKE